MYMLMYWLNINEVLSIIFKTNILTLINTKKYNIKNCNTKKSRVVLTSAKIGMFLKIF